MPNPLGGRWHIDIAPQFRAGDPPPAGYCDWHEWARVQHRAGLRQDQCPGCGRWMFPQERADHARCFEIAEAAKRAAKVVLEEIP